MIVKWMKSLMVLLLTFAVFTVSVFASDGLDVAQTNQNDEVEVIFSEALSDANKSSNISVTAMAKNKNVKITSLELPDGSVVEGSEANFKVDKNDSYAVQVNYDVLIETQVIEESKNDENKADERLSTDNSQVQEDIGTISNDENDMSRTKLDEVAKAEPEFASKTYAVSYAVTSIGTEMKEDTANLLNTRSEYTDESLFEFDATTGKITRYTGPNGVHLNIPPTIGGVTVSGLADYAFSRGRTFESITLPDTLTWIGSYAFYNNKITGPEPLVIPASVRTIWDRAFVGLECKGLEFFDNTGLGLLYLETFKNVVLDGGNGTLRIPEGITTISSGMLCEGSRIKRLELPSTLGSIYENNFSNANFSEVDFSKTKNIESIGKNAFSGNKLTGTLDFSNNTGLWKIEDSAFANQQIESVKFPDTIERIGANAFSGNNLKEVIFPETLKGNSSSKPLYLGFRCFGGGNQISFLDFKKNYISASEVLSGNKINGVPYSKSGTFNYIDLSLSYKYEALRFSIDEERTRYRFAADLGLRPDDVAGFAKYMPTYDSRFKRVRLPDDSILESTVNVNGETRKVKDYYGFIFQYQVASDYTNGLGDLLYTDGGSFVEFTNFDEGISLYYDLNRGNTSEVTHLFTFKNKLLQEPVPPTRDGYVFNGWYMSKVGGFSWSFKHHLISNYIKEGATSFTLYAQWKLETANVTFDANTGQFSGNNKVITKSVALGEPLGTMEIPTHPDKFKFKGWNTSKDGKGTYWNLFSDVFVQDVTLYAIWEFDDSLQEASMLVSIPSDIRLTKSKTDKDYASANSEIKVVKGTSYDQWIPDRDIEVFTNPTIELKNQNTSDKYNVFILDENGNKYMDSSNPLLVLNAYGNNGYKPNSQFTLKTWIKEDTRMTNNYTGVMVFTIQLK